MTEYEKGYIGAATTLCMLGHWFQAAEMIKESGLLFDFDLMDEVDQQYIKELSEREGKALGDRVSNIK